MIQLLKRRKDNLTVKHLYDKSKIWFAVTWIVAYCVLMSVGDSLSTMLGLEKSVTLVIGVALSALILSFLGKYGLLAEHGLCKAKTPAAQVLFYIPLLLMLTANFWCGVGLNYSILETILYILAMFCVGFLEEVIFRGLLFEAMRKDSERAATIVCAVTFGIGHIINLINGSGAQLLPNLLQVVYATAAGFMFVMLYRKTGSLLVCIISHGLFNALSAFSKEAVTDELRIITALLLTTITGAYALYLALTPPDKSK